MSMRKYASGRAAWPLLLVAVLLAACGSEGELILRHAATGGDGVRRVVFIAGKDSHGPGAHEHRAGSELLAAALHAAYPEDAVDVVYGGWPADERLLDGVDAVVIYADGGRRHPVNGHLARFERLLADGVGVVTLHYAVEVPKDSAAAAAMLRAVGGYFETGWSVNPHWEARFNALPAHPITRGIRPFSLRDEWYFNMRFQPGLAGVRPVLYAVPPPESMERGDGPHSGNAAVRAQVDARKPQVVAWGYDRPGGGRGFGYTGGHFHANWDDDDARRLVVNAIHWTAQGHP